jgi:hypothetical protein
MFLVFAGESLLCWSGRNNGRHLGRGQVGLDKVFWPGGIHPRSVSATAPGAALVDDSTKDAPGKFSSPPRILIPKLAQSRDNWKSKANQRSRDLKKAQIRSRDLAISRERWKQRAEIAEQQLLALQEQLKHTQQVLEQARDEVARLPQEGEKNSFKPS